MTINIIAAVGNNNAIGRKGQLCFYIPEDLRHFKKLTTGNPVIMGRKTFESLPNGALPNRRNVVVSRQSRWNAPDVETVHSLDEAFRLLASHDQVFVIGGAQIYQQALPYADRLYITFIHADDCNADTFFPDFTDNFIPVESQPVAIDTDSKIEYQFITFERKSSQ